MRTTAKQITEERFPELKIQAHTAERVLKKPHLPVLARLNASVDSWTKLKETLTLWDSPVSFPQTFHTVSAVLKSQTFCNLSWRSQLVFPRGCSYREWEKRHLTSGLHGHLFPCLTAPRRAEAQREAGQIWHVAGDIWGRLSTCWKHSRQSISPGA